MTGRGSSEEMTGGLEDLVSLIEDLFWERDLKADDLSRYPIWVLVRVLNMGSLGQVRASVAHFGKGVLQEALEAPGLEPRARRFWRVYLERTT